jgi:DNA-binding FrmR family transcriptional regulator
LRCKQPASGAPFENPITVITMIEAGRPCVDLAQQLHAVEAAIGNAKRELIHDHIDHCLTGDGDARATVRELKQLTKFL